MIPDIIIPTMNILHTIILSFVEGITEFLPISSTGHLVLAAHILGIPQTEFAKTFEIFIQLGAILAVIAVYFRTFLKKPAVLKNVIIAFIPAGIIGFILYKLIKNVLLGNPWITISALFIGGIILIIFEKIVKKQQNISLENLSPMKAIIIGIGQSLAIIPGVSRSGASIVTGMLVGLSRENAVEFSFLIAVPTVTAASLFDLVKSSVSFSLNDFILLIIGTAVSFIVAYITVNIFLKYVKKNSFVSFGIYRIFIALLYIFLFR